MLRPSWLYRERRRLAPQRKWKCRKLAMKRYAIAGQTAGSPDSCLDEKGQPSGARLVFFFDYVSRLRKVR
jgi:hypothetical protein